MARIGQNRDQTEDMRVIDPEHISSILTSAEEDETNARRKKSRMIIGIISCGSAMTQKQPFIPSTKPSQSLPLLNSKQYLTSKQKRERNHTERANDNDTELQKQSQIGHKTLP